jgi:predicted Fe-Mo cluster-binding NifX family protein
VKIALSINGNDLNALFDPRFGRAQAFCIVDTESADYQIFSNAAVAASGGAGVAAAQFVADKQVDAVISGSFGPNAYDTLAAANIKMYSLPGGAGLKIQDIIEKFAAGEMGEPQSPNHGGYHGRGRGSGGGRRRGAF